MQEICGSASLLQDLAQLCGWCPGLGQDLAGKEEGQCGCSQRCSGNISQCLEQILEVSHIGA